MRPRELALQFVQPVKNGACLVNAAAQDYVIEEGGIAAFGIGKALRFQVVEEFLAGNHFIIDEARDLVWKNALCEIEFDEEDNANLAWPLDRPCEPLKKGITPGCREVEDFARWAHALRFQFGLYIVELFELFQEGVHLAHFEVHDLAQGSRLELLEHFVAVHGLIFEQSQDSIFGRFTDLHCSLSTIIRKKLEQRYYSGLWGVGQDLKPEVKAFGSIAYYT